MKNFLLSLKDSNFKRSKKRDVYLKMFNFMNKLEKKCNILFQIQYITSYNTSYNTFFLFHYVSVVFNMSVFEINSIDLNFHLFHFMSV